MHQEAGKIFNRLILANHAQQLKLAKHSLKTFEPNSWIFYSLLLLEQQSAAAMLLERSNELLVSTNKNKLLSRFNECVCGH
jgi:hypothetical protein